MKVEVFTSEIQHTMQAGLGASWHAISKDIPLNNELYKYPVRTNNSRGSAWGGNPPVTDTEAWKQIKEHASWLGLNFLRVELSQRMYEPERKQYNWDNDEMLALYKILDWCEENGADVFLQQMWHNVEWNSLPGVHPLISAPKDLADFAGGIATLINYLIHEKSYTCIKYFCMTNEPPGPVWGYWWDYGDTEGSIDEAWGRLKEEFDRRNINIPISGPDWTGLPPLNKEILRFAKYLGAIDIHSYQGVTERGEAILKDWAEWSHAQGKPFLLTEIGNMSLGWGTDNPGPKSFDAAISNTCDIIRGMRAGVDGFNRWSFTNRGDLDGQWQLIKTFDRENQVYLSEILPEPEAYYGFAMVSRFLAKYSSVVSCNNNLPDSLLMTAALLSPGGELSIFIVNLQENDVDISLQVNDFPEKELHLYQASKALVNEPGYQTKAVMSFHCEQRRLIKLPARSISTVSSYLLSPEDGGIINGGIIK